LACVSAFIIFALTSFIGFVSPVFALHLTMRDFAKKHQPHSDFFSETSKRL
jgi:hypothetical protein